MIGDSAHPIENIRVKINADQCTMAGNEKKLINFHDAADHRWCKDLQEIHKSPTILLSSFCCNNLSSYTLRYCASVVVSSHHDCSKYQCVSISKSSTSNSSDSSCQKDNLVMCNNCNPNFKKRLQRHQQSNCKIKAVCDLNNNDNCQIISLGDNNYINNNTNKSDSIVSRNRGNIRKNYFTNTSNNILNHVKKSKFLKTIKNRLLVHAIVFVLILQLFTLPTLVYGLTSNNQTLHHHHMIMAGGSGLGGTSSLASSLTASSSSLSEQERDDTSDGISIFKNRENTIRREPNLSYTTGGCHSCRLREQVKADNLASIKRHILLRLELKTPPNITSPIVPREIIEKFYKNHNMFNRSSSSSNSNSGDPGSKRLMNSPSYDSMQGDDPRPYIDYNPNLEENESEDYEEEFFSVVNSLYVFPTMPRMRHNRKPDILHFSFTNNGHSSVSQAILHVYIRGRDWLHEFEPSILNESENISNGGGNRQEIVLTINRVLRRQNSPNSTHTQKVNEVRQVIPNGLGSWITIDVTEMATNWFNNPNTNHGLVIKTLELWMKPLVVTDDSPSNKVHALYIEIQTKDNRKRRTKRNTSLNCSESDNEERCCRYPLEVDFRKFDWDWIVAPTSFNAYFCNGECKLGFLPKYPHTHLMQLSTAPQPCCSPTKMSPIKLLYFNNDRNLVMSTIPNMAVDKCSCS